MMPETWLPTLHGRDRRERPRGRHRRDDVALVELRLPVLRLGRPAAREQQERRERGEGDGDSDDQDSFLHELLENA